MSQISSIIKSKECIIFTIIVVVDLITKLMANGFLPFKEIVPLIGEKVCFYLIYNQGSVGGQANFLLQNVHNINLSIILSCFSALILFGYILLIRKRKIRTFYKVLIGIGLFVLLSITISFIEPLFENINISSWTTSVVAKLIILTILFCILFFFRLEKWIRISLVIIFAAGIGNFLSHFYYPYHIIDFISVEGSYKLLRIGVFNIADLAFDFGLLGLILSVLIYELKKSLNKIKKRTAK